MGKTCIECGKHVPEYLNFLCEDCWKEMLNKKVAEDEQEKVIVKFKFQERNYGSPESKWF